MLEATLRDRARRLLTASGRSDVPPFMVMDVMAAAARIEAAGGHVIHMEVGQPAADLGLTVADVGARSGDARVAIAAVAVAIGRRKGNGRARRFPGRVVGRALEIH